MQHAVQSSGGGQDGAVPGRVLVPPPRLAARGAPAPVPSLTAAERAPGAARATPTREYTPYYTVVRVGTPL